MTDQVEISPSVHERCASALESAKSLQRTVESFDASGREISGLRKELDTLNHALLSLQEAVPGFEEEYNTLRLPLLRCAKSCKDYEDTIMPAKPSGESGSSAKAWKKLKYMDYDISGFTHMLAMYQSMFRISQWEVKL